MELSQRFEKRGYRHKTTHKAYNKAKKIESNCGSKIRSNNNGQLSVLCDTIQK